MFQLAWWHPPSGPRVRAAIMRRYRNGSADLVAMAPDGMFIATVMRVPRGLEARNARGHWEDDDELPLQCGLDGRREHPGVPDDDDLLQPGGRLDADALDARHVEAELAARVFLRTHFNVCRVGAGR